MKYNFKNMSRKYIIFSIIGLLLIAGGVFWWWQNQEDVRELNKGLPEGVKVAKSLIGREYKIVNKKDGYEFVIPKEWGGLSKIEYEEDKETNSKGFTLTGLNGEVIGLGYYQLSYAEISLDSWVRSWKDQFEAAEWTIEKVKIDHRDIIKAQEKKHLMGLTFTFFKEDSRIYLIHAMPTEEKFIPEIISNGKW